MKLNVDEDSNIPDITSVEHRNRISLPRVFLDFLKLGDGIGFDQEELPFMWLREDKKDGLAFFIVIEPGGIIRIIR